MNILCIDNCIFMYSLKYRSSTVQNQIDRCMCVHFFLFKRKKKILRLTTRAREKKQKKNRNNMCSSRLYTMIYKRRHNSSNNNKDRTKTYSLLFFVWREKKILDLSSVKHSWHITDNHNRFSYHWQKQSNYLDWDFNKGKKRNITLT